MATLIDTFMTPLVDPGRALLVQLGLFLSVLLLFSSTIRLMRQKISDRRMARFLGSRDQGEGAAHESADGEIDAKAAHATDAA